MTLEELQKAEEHWTARARALKRSAEKTWAMAVLTFVRYAIAATERAEKAEAERDDAKAQEKA